MKTQSYVKVISKYGIIHYINEKYLSHAMESYIKFHSSLQLVQYAELVIDPHTNTLIKCRYDLATLFEIGVPTVVCTLRIE